MEEAWTILSGGVSQTHNRKKTKSPNLSGRWGNFYAKRFGRREVPRTNIINKDGGPINPKKGGSTRF